MLTASQCEIVAYRGAYGPLCPVCARAEFGAIAIVRVDERLSDVPTPHIRYEISDQYAGQEYEVLRHNYSQSHGAATAERLADRDWDAGLCRPTCAHCDASLG